VTTPRLIETWLPIAALGEESVRERRSMTALPPTYYLHVWWARRPLVASRAAVLASLLPADADHEKFLHAIGIHGDPVASRRRIDQAKRAGQRFEGEAYSYPRAFGYNLTDTERQWLKRETARIGIDVPRVLDPTAGGGSIPFEAVRLGAEVLANDLNPVAALILRATVELPLKHGAALRPRFEALAAEFVRRRDKRLQPFFPPEPEPAWLSGTVSCMIARSWASRRGSRT
jgi:adenine-specific DNA methylase